MHTSTASHTNLSPMALVGMAELVLHGKSQSTWPTLRRRSADTTAGLRGSLDLTRRSWQGWSRSYERPPTDQGCAWLQTAMACCCC